MEPPADADICGTGGKERITCRRPQKTPYLSWDDFSARLPDAQFRRTFRMGKNEFSTLCSRLCDKVTENVFKPEFLVQQRLFDDRRTANASSYHGGLISGEFKVALAIRMLAGASYLDLVLIFAVSSCSVFNIFHEVVDWINTTFHFPLESLIRNKDSTSLSKISDGFASFTRGVFKGCIGAIDGIALKIRCPSPSDRVPDPGNYYCRKGYYALNVQAIVDSHKRFLWVSVCHKGSNHDSPGFQETEFSVLLQRFKDFLVAGGFFLIGDSAYNLLSYFLVPFENPQPNSM